MHSILVAVATVIARKYFSRIFVTAVVNLRALIGGWWTAALVLVVSSPNIFRGHKTGYKWPIWMIFC